MLEILDDVAVSNDDMELHYIDSVIVTLFSYDVDINAIDFDNVSLDDDDLAIIIWKLWLMLDLWVGVMNNKTQGI